MRTGSEGHLLTATTRSTDSYFPATSRVLSTDGSLPSDWCQAHISASPRVPTTNLSTATTTTAMTTTQQQPQEPRPRIGFRVKHEPRTRTLAGVVPRTRTAAPARVMMTVLVAVTALAVGQVRAFSRQPPPSPTPPVVGPPPPTSAPLAVAPTPTAAPSTAVPTATDDGGFGLDQPCDENWNETAVEYLANLDEWGNPDCYFFTIQRSCFCPDTIRNPVEVKVVNGTIVAPADYEDLYLMTIDALFEQIFDLCVKNCPDRGAARCDVSYGPRGNPASVYIDRSFMIADEETSYTITGYRTCPSSSSPPGTGNARDRNLLRRSSA